MFNIDKYLNIIYKYKWLIVILIPTIAILSLINLKNLEIDGSYRIWFEKNSSNLQVYDRFLSDFSNDNGVTITFKDENGIFNRKALAAIERITNSLWDLEYIDNVSSLVNYQYIYAKKDAPNDILVENFIQNISKAPITYFEERKKIALNDSIIVNGLISADGKTTTIFARLSTDADKDGDISAQVMSDINAMLDKELEKTGYKFWTNGGPAITHAFVKIAEHDVKLFTPLVFFLAMLLLYLMFRKISGAIIPMIVVLFTFVIVISVQVLLGYKLNNFTANIPVFIMAIGIADAVHIYSVWLLKRKMGHDNYHAVKEALEANFLPIFLTSITTIIGFMTLTISHVVPVATLGIATASGAILAFLISVIWMPALLIVLDTKVDKNAEVTIFKVNRLRYGAFIVKYNKKIVITFTVIILIIGGGLSQLKVDSNVIRYFDKDEEVRKASEFIINNITGSMSYAVVIDSKKKDGAKEPEFLSTIERFNKEFKSAFPNDVRHISSLVDILKRYNRVLAHKEEVPQTRNLVAQYMLLYSMSLPEGMTITDKIDFDERKLYVRVLLNMVDASKELEMIKYIKTWWQNNTPYSIEVTGQAVLYAYMQKDVTNTLIYSFLLTLVIISFIMFLIFKRLKIVWILLLPNILPVIMILGMMGWSGFAIDMGVAITGAIIIGVAIDDTIHFLVKFFELRKQNIPIQEALDQVLSYVGRAIIFTTIVLSASFSIFIFSDFVPNQNFGIVTTMALLIALLVDLLFLPSLLSLADEKNR